MEQKKQQKDFDKLQEDIIERSLEDLKNKRIYEL